VVVQRKGNQTKYIYPRHSIAKPNKNHEECKINQWNCALFAECALCRQTYYSNLSIKDKIKCRKILGNWTIHLVVLFLKSSFFYNIFSLPWRDSVTQFCTASLHVKYSWAAAMQLATNLVFFATALIFSKSSFSKVSQEYKRSVLAAFLLSLLIQEEKSV
jgi:hypothetical protein